MRASHFLPALNGGELSPLLLARIDLAKHGAACQRLSNFLPLVEGPVTRRPGSQYMGSATNHARVWLVPFVFGRRDAWLLELSSNHMRFWVGDGVVSEEGSPFIVGTAWNDNALAGADGQLALSFAQLRDRMWFAGGGRPPYLLERRAPTDWQLQPFRPTGGPFDRENVEENRRVYVEGDTGALGYVDLRVPEDDEPVFNFASPLGRRIRLFINLDNDARPWAAGASVTAGQVRKSDGRYYKALNSGTTGGVRPIHNEGAAFDASSGGVEWRFLHAGFGVVRLQAVFSGHWAYGRVEVALPDGLTGEVNATPRWALSPWGQEEGYPTAVGFGFKRLVFGRGNQLWFSRTDDFFSFADRSPEGILAEDALTLTLSGQGVTTINWLQETPAGLVVGTDGGEFLVTKANTADVFGAVTDATRNAEVIRHTAYGSRQVPPSLAHGRLVMVDVTGRKLREIDRRLEVDRLEALDLTAMAGHILGSGVTWQAWQDSPDNVLWLGLADGTLVSCTYMPEQEIVSFARHRLGGDAFVEHGAVIPADDGDGTELWLVARRLVNGANRRSIERLFPRWPGGLGISSAASRHLDAALVYDGAPVSSIIAGGHLAGLTVPALADGFDVPALTFDEEGAAELPFPASLVVVGYPYASEVELLVPNAGGMDGPGIGKKRRARELILTLIESADQFMAGLTDKLRRIDQRSANLSPTATVPLVTDDIRVPVDLGWQRRPKLGVMVDGPLPFTLAAVLQRLDVSE